ncbi:MAG: glycosyl hydrolase family 18 protein [Mucilaginibacter sp.]|uniref:glycosyl hydrolase family 18 protein n=1 Tax=Mucilaginibacter sp. TaxID=1882438 RepID=UPI0032656F6A
MNKNLLLLAFLCAFVLYSCKKSGEEPQGVTTPVTPPPTTPVTITPPPAFGFYVVSYFPSYRDINLVSDSRFKMCNVVCYAFATLSSTGALTVASPSVLSAVVVKAKRTGTKVMISLNGDAADWKTMAATATGRTNYIKKVMNTVRTYDLQGVDVDWEFPSTADGTDITYTALMKELSDSCHVNAKYYLTATLTSGKYVGSYTNAIKDEILKGVYVDFFNIMAYDDFNTSVPYRQHSNYALAQTCLNYWVTTRGLPASKAVLGMPAYGRPSGITQSGTILSYSGILGQGGSALSDSAVVTAGGFTNYKIYYNGMPTIKKKTMLAKSMANGIMFWEMGQDTNDGTCLLKAACDTIGRAY